MILNDRVLKVYHPGALSGKLSDFGGLIYFPLFLVAFIEGLRWLIKRQTWPMGPRAVAVAVIVVGAAFIFIKTSHPAAEFYRAAMGAVMWPVNATWALSGGHPLPALNRVVLVEDKTDLFAVIALWVPWWVSRRVMTRKSMVTR